MENLTDRQIEIYSFIKRFIKKTGYPPSTKDIMQEFGFNSTNTPRSHLKALQKKGFISIEPRVSRGIKLI